MNEMSPGLHLKFQINMLFFLNCVEGSIICVNLIEKIMIIIAVTFLYIDHLQH